MSGMWHRADNGKLVLVSEESARLPMQAVCYLSIQAMENQKSSALQ